MARGGVREGAGRPVGSLSKSSAEIRQVIVGAVEFLPLVKKLEELGLAGNLTAIKLLFEYGCGRPVAVWDNVREEGYRRDDEENRELYGIP